MTMTTTTTTLQETELSNEVKKDDDSKSENEDVPRFYVDYIIEAESDAHARTYR